MTARLGSHIITPLILVFCLAFPQFKYILKNDFCGDYLVKQISFSLHPSPSPPLAYPFPSNHPLFAHDPQVTPLPVEEIRALAKEITTNGLHSLRRMFAEGDQKTCSETSTSIVSLLNSDSKRTRSGACCMSRRSLFR